MNYLGDQGIFLPTRLLSNPEKLKAIDGHLVHSIGSAQINPLIQTMAGPCRLRNISVKIISDNDNHVVPGNACAGEIILGNPFLKASGLDVKDFLADNIERLSAIDYGNLEVEERTAKVGKLGLKLLSNDIGMAEGEIEPTKLCSMMSNDNFPIKDSTISTTKMSNLGFKTTTKSKRKSTQWYFAARSTWTKTRDQLCDLWSMSSRIFSE